MRMQPEEDSPPPLEDMSLSAEDVAADSPLVFDPIFGVIPSDVKQLWDEQEEERSRLYSQMVQSSRRRRMPPVRGGD
jgi:hypothetical protein